jgi:hypothetical protein
MCSHDYFPTRRKHQLLAVGLCVKMSRERLSDFSFRKMTEKLEQRYCIKFCYNLVDTKRKPFNKLSGMIP